MTETEEMTVSQAAAMLGMVRSRAYQLVADGTLEVTRRLGPKATFVSTASVKRYLEVIRTRRTGRWAFRRGKRRARR